MELKQFILLMGSIIMVVSHLHFTVLAFKEKILTGIICLVIPGYSIIHALSMETREAKMGLKGLGIGVLMVLFGKIVM